MILKQNVTAIVIALSQGFADDGADLCFRLGGQLGEEGFLAVGDVILTLLERLLGLVPSLLGDLLFRLFAAGWVGTDASVSLLVDGFNLQQSKKSSLVSIHKRMFLI